MHLIFNIKTTVSQKKKKNCVSCEVITILHPGPDISILELDTQIFKIAQST